jgi:predicted nuclease of predicted toxin-antitoxin system
MSLKFFADHCVPNSIILSLLDSGYDVLKLRDYIPTDSSDSEVISVAEELDTILISLNGDFADIVMYPPSKFNGIIAIQVRNHPEIIPQIMERLKNYLSAHSDMSYYKGKLIIAEVHRIRIRK